MDVKKFVTDAAVLKAVSDAMAMAGKRRKPAAKKVKRAGKTLGKSVETLGMTASKTVEELGAMAGKTVEGIGSTVSKTVEGLGATAGKTAGAVGEAVEKTVETTVHKTRDMTVGKVDEMRTQRRLAKLAKKRAKLRKQRMDGLGMWFGFGLIVALLYWWEKRRDKSVQGLATDAGEALRSAAGTVSRTAQQVAPKVGSATGDALRSVKETVTRSMPREADRGMEAEGNGHTSGPAQSGEALRGRSEVTAPGELRGPTGPEISAGMKVVGFDGVDIGRVQEVEEDAFILDRPKGSDLRVPKEAAARVEGTVVYLRIAANRVVQQGWESTGQS